MTFIKTELSIHFITCISGQKFVQEVRKKVALSEPPLILVGLLYFSVSTPSKHVSVSPTNGNGPTQGQRKTLTRVGVRVFLCPCVGPFPLVGLTLTWFIWGRNLALHITL